MPTNQERVDWAMEALRIPTFDENLPDVETTCIDLITNLLHLIHGSGRNYQAILNMAQIHFESEIIEEEELLPIIEQP